MNLIGYAVTGAPFLGGGVAEFCGTLVIGLLLLWLFLFGVEFGNAAVGFGIFFVDFYGFLIASNGFSEFVLLGVSTADETVSFALIGGDAGGGAVEGDSAIILSVVEVDVTQAVVGWDVGAVVFDDSLETFYGVLLLAFEEVGPTKAVDEFDGFAIYFKSFF